MFIRVDLWPIRLLSQPCLFNRSLRVLIDVEAISGVMLTEEERERDNDSDNEPKKSAFHGSAPDAATPVTKKGCVSTLK